MGKYDRYICTRLHKRENLPGPDPAERDKLAAEGKRIKMEHVLWIDSDIIPGGYYGESAWIWPPTFPNQISKEELAARTHNAHPMFPHDHSFPELLSWWGTDPDHPEDTTTMGMYIDGEIIPMKGSFVAYLPAGIKHMPVWPAGGNVSSRPVFHWTSGPGGVYDREKETDEGKPAVKVEPIPQDTRTTPPFKYEKYIVYGYKKGVKRPDYMCDLDPRYARPAAYIDQTVIPDAEFGCDTWWLLPGNDSNDGQTIMEAHTLPHGTSITFTAMNYDDITDLCAEVEIWIGGEKYIINNSFGAYIPPDVEQGPLVIRGIKKQIFFMMSQPVGEGLKKYRG